MKKAVSHYFTDPSNTKQNRRDIPFRFLGFEYKVMSDDGVFSKDGLDIGTESLLKVLVKENISGNVADLGCGIGVIGVILSKYFDLEYSGFDVNSRSVELANINYERYQVKGINIHHDGLFGSFDTIISNPPIRVGKEKLYQLFDNVYEHTKPGGTFYFVIRKSHGAQSARKKVSSLFGNCTLLKKDKGFYIYKAERLDEVAIL